MTPVQREGLEAPGAQALEAAAASVEASAVASGAAVAAVVEVVVGAAGLVEARPKIRSGSLSPSWAVWSRT
jgi:hypothetical protein